MIENPESRVIDAIDELVNEQLAGGPVDDFNADRYVKCPHCQCDWHGIRCTCGCNWDCRSDEGELASSGVRHDPAPWQRRGLDVDDLIIDDDDDLLDDDAIWDIRSDPVFRRGRRDIVHHVCVPSPVDGHCVHPDCSTIFAGPAAPPWVIYHDRCDIPGCELRPGEHAHGGGGGPGYTLGDLERMRDQNWRPQAYIQQDGVQRVFGDRASPVIRFWTAEGNRLEMIEGVARVMQIDWVGNSCTVRAELDHVRRILWGHPRRRREAGDPHPVGEIVPGLISVEGAVPDGFEHIGYLGVDDLEIEHNRETGYTWSGATVVLDETHEVSIRIPDNMIGHGILERFNARHH